MKNSIISLCLSKGLSAYIYIYSWGGEFKPCISPLKILRSVNQLNYKIFDKLKALLSKLSRDQLDGLK